MFVQIHMLQSMPPGNLNRDDSGQPKKCVFGGVTRGRISSQCLKRNIRHSMQFKEAYGDGLAARTTHLPRLVAEELKSLMPDISKEEMDKIKVALTGKFKAEAKAEVDAEEAEEGEEDNKKPQGNSASTGIAEQTGQLVFFPPPFAKSIAKRIVDFKKEQPEAFNWFIKSSKKTISKEEKKALDKQVNVFIDNVATDSKLLTVDIGLFGRMTTSDLVVNVEASCQVAHAISTHETLIESDYFTAMDDLKEGSAAAFMGTGDTETFFNSAVYYKYLNLDLDALKKHLGWQGAEVARVAGVLASAAALANPKGKQNSFAAHGVPELILVEVSKTKRPISYANAFLQPVEGQNLMEESAKSLKAYIETVVAAFEPADVRRVLFAVGAGAVEVKGARCVAKIDDLPKAVASILKEGAA